VPDRGEIVTPAMEQEMRWTAAFNAGTMALLVVSLWRSGDYFAAAASFSGALGWAVAWSYLPQENDDRADGRTSKPVA